MNPFAYVCLPRDVAESSTAVNVSRKSKIFDYTNNMQSYIIDEHLSISFEREIFETKVASKVRKLDFDCV